MSKNQARSEFEWSEDIANGMATGYGRAEIKITIAPSNYISRSDKFRHDALIKAANFLTSVADELGHMAKGVDGE